MYRVIICGEVPFSKGGAGGGASWLPTAEDRGDTPGPGSYPLARRFELGNAESWSSFTGLSDLSVESFKLAGTNLGSPRSEHQHTFKP